VLFALVVESLVGNPRFWHGNQHRCHRRGSSLSPSLQGYGDICWDSGRTVFGRGNVALALSPAPAPDDEKDWLGRSGDSTSSNSNSNSIDSDSNDVEARRNRRRRRQQKDQNQEKESQLPKRGTTPDRIARRKQRQRQVDNSVAKDDNDDDDNDAALHRERRRERRRRTEPDPFDPYVKEEEEDEDDDDDDDYDSDTPEDLAEDSPRSRRRRRLARAERNPSALNDMIALGTRATGLAKRQTQRLWREASARLDEYDYENKNENDYENENYYKNDDSYYSQDGDGGGQSEAPPRRRSRVRTPRRQPPPQPRGEPSPRASSREQQQQQQQQQQQRSPPRRSGFNWPSVAEEEGRQRQHQHQHQRQRQRRSRRDSKGECFDVDDSEQASPSSSYYDSGPGNDSGELRSPRRATRAKTKSDDYEETEEITTVEYYYNNDDDDDDDDDDDEIFPTKEDSDETSVGARGQDAAAAAAAKPRKKPVTVEPARSTDWDASVPFPGNDDKERDQENKHSKDRVRGSPNREGTAKNNSGMNNAPAPAASAAEVAETATATATASAPKSETDPSPLPIGKLLAALDEREIAYSPRASRSELEDLLVLGRHTNHDESIAVGNAGSTPAVAPVARVNQRPNRETVVSAIKTPVATRRLDDDVEVVIEVESISPEEWEQQRQQKQQMQQKQKQQQEKEKEKQQQKKQNQSRDWGTNTDATPSTQRNFRENIKNSYRRSRFSAPWGAARRTNSAGGRQQKSRSRSESRPPAGARSSRRNQRSPSPSSAGSSTAPSASADRKSRRIYSPYGTNHSPPSSTAKSSNGGKRQRQREHQRPGKREQRQKMGRSNNKTNSDSEDEEIENDLDRFGDFVEDDLGRFGEFLAESVDSIFWGTHDHVDADTKEDDPSRSHSAEGRGGNRTQPGRRGRSQSGDDVVAPSGRSHWKDRAEERLDRMMGVHRVGGKTYDRWGKKEAMEEAEDRARGYDAVSYFQGRTRSPRERKRRRWRPRGAAAFWEQDESILSILLGQSHDQGGSWRNPQRWGEDLRGVVGSGRTLTVLLRTVLLGGARVTEALCKWASVRDTIPSPLVLLAVAAAGFVSRPGDRLKSVLLTFLSARILGEWLSEPVEQAPTSRGSERNRSNGSSRRGYTEEEEEDDDDDHDVYDDHDDDDDGDGLFEFDRDRQR